VFLLGAGFNADAASEAGDRNGAFPNRPPGYPMVGELLSACFGIRTVPSGKTIEDLFQESIDAGNTKPFEKLYELLREADYFIAPRLRAGEGHDENVYLKFLRDFPDAPLLTFNYDSLSEIVLIGEGTWSPQDGYGVTVKAGVGWGIHKAAALDHSRRYVLHLHGSLCIYTASFEIENSLLQHKDRPDFRFDPDNLANCFHPFVGISRDVANDRTDMDRVIALVPNKSEGLKRVFIETVYDRATDFVRNAPQIVAIGYRFNRYDSASYSPLLDGAINKSILLVGPHAASLIDRLRCEHPNIQWKAESASFKQWVSEGYSGI
jgi:hypothetical protein